MKGQFVSDPSAGVKSGWICDMDLSCLYMQPMHIFSDSECALVAEELRKIAMSYHIPIITARQIRPSQTKTSISDIIEQNLSERRKMKLIKKTLTPSRQYETITLSGELPN